MQPQMNKLNQQQRVAELSDSLHHSKDSQIALNFLELAEIWKQQAIQEFGAAQTMEDFVRAQTKFNTVKRMKAVFTESRVSAKK